VDDVIRTSALRKTFGETLAIDGLDLSVAQGEVHGFLGPNGAGKTTTLRLLPGAAASRRRRSDAVGR
jgi:ABC-2 type transport system ATP-binding protein